MKTDGLCFQTKKTCFVLFHEALEISKRMARESEAEKGYYIAVYLCSYCNCYHIGNKLRYNGVYRNLDYYTDLDCEDSEEIFNHKIKHVTFKDYKRKFRKRPSTE